MTYKIDDVLDYLDTWKTRRAIEEKFVLSNTQSYNLIKRLLKMHLIEDINVRMDKETRKKNKTFYTHWTNRVWLYKATKKN